MRMRELTYLNGVSVADRGDVRMDVVVDITNTVIETERLILRAWQETDLDDFFEYASVEGVGENAGWRHHESIEDSRTILKIFISSKDEFAITDKINNKVIGSLGIHKSWANDDAKYAGLKLKDIGYVLSKEYWGNGLMPEAVKAVINFCFNVLELDAVTCGHSPSNHQSKRVIEKNGFEYVKTSDYYFEQFDHHTHSMRYILLNNSHKELHTK